MELRQESVDRGAPSVAISRNPSSSSSAFVSANESPFFSPCFQSAPDLATSYHSAPNGGIVLSLCTPTTYGTPVTVYNNPSAVSSFVGDCNGDSPHTNEGTNSGKLVCREKQKRSRRSRESGKSFSFSRAPASASASASVSSTAYRVRSCDVYIGFHGHKPSLLRFVNWLRAELEIQGISCFASDQARIRNARGHDAAERIMNSSSYGVIILSKKSFGNPYTIEELKCFSGKKNLAPIYFELGACDCLARDIIERRGEIWEKHGGELWMMYNGLEREWREAVDGLLRMVDSQLEANGGNLRDCISQAVALLGTKLGRRSVVDRINQWREKAEREEFPFPRNEAFVGRAKELSNLELILFGDVRGDGEKEYFKLKPRHAQNGRRDIDIKEQQRENSVRGKEPVLWKESEKEIEMQRQCRTLRANFGGRCRKKKRSTNILYGKGIACVSGDAGIGKTELVLEYAYRYSQRYKMILWLQGESRYIRQSYLALRSLLEVDLSVGNHCQEKERVRCFEEQEEEAVARIRKELMRDIPFLVIIDNLENEKDWWDRKDIMDLIPCFGRATHVIVTTRLTHIMRFEPMKLSYLSGAEAMALMKGDVKHHPLMEIDALRTIEEKLGRLTLGLSIVGAILSKLPITPRRLLDAIKRMPLRDFALADGEALALKKHLVLVQLLDVCLSIFDHADGPRSLASRMVQVGCWFGPSSIPIHLLALAAGKASEKHQSASAWKKYFRALRSSFSVSRVRRSEAEAASMLMRFGVAKASAKPDCIHLHELIRLYARKRGAARAAVAVVQSIYLRGSLSQHSEHQWAACFLVFGFGTESSLTELRPTELLLFIKRVVLPLAVHTFATFSRCNASLELLRVATDALELAAESLLSRTEKRLLDKSFCCSRPVQKRARHTYLWQELALLKAAVLETRAKLMLRGGEYDKGDDIIRKAIFIRASICGEHHPDTVSARETLRKLTRLLTNFQI
ncbi:uncharacterized protein LOC109715499 [Ananas comosus]|uniref:Uncharacterized protein LOC109715499 n=2 Tax=Ananas comosus TaxID=4615 RepID=A0A6P5FKF9_ANACO|nr:uncharacterized protein LOC109715499 [Ananas comosus]